MVSGAPNSAIQNVCLLDCKVEKMTSGGLESQLTVVLGALTVQSKSDSDPLRLGTLGGCCLTQRKYCWDYAEFCGGMDFQIVVVILGILWFIDQLAGLPDISHQICLFTSPEEEKNISPPHLHAFGSTSRRLMGYLLYHRTLLGCWGSSSAFSFFSHIRQARAHLLSGHRQLVKLRARQGTGVCECDPLFSFLPLHQVPSSIQCPGMKYLIFQKCTCLMLSPRMPECTRPGTQEETSSPRPSPG